jgi:hypothetical protein
MNVESSLGERPLHRLRGLTMKPTRPAARLSEVSGIGREVSWMKQEASFQELASCLSPFNRDEPSIRLRWE